MNSYPLFYTLTRNVKHPTRGTEDSAGLDLYVPEDLTEELLIPSQGSRLIPSGVKFNIPKGTALVAFNKSSIATKLGLIVGACVIDADYMGEVHIHLINTSDTHVSVPPGCKIIQLLHIPVIMNDPVYYASVDELYQNKSSERGEGGFGSTGH